jgi:hypothetical protein
MTGGLEARNIPTFYLKTDRIEKPHTQSFPVVLPLATVAILDQKITFSDDVIPAPQNLETIDMEAVPFDYYSQCLVVLKRLRTSTRFEEPPQDTIGEEKREDKIIVSLRERDLQVINGILVEEINCEKTDLQIVNPNIEAQEHKEVTNKRKIDATVRLLRQLNNAFIAAGGPQSKIVDYLSKEFPPDPLGQTE